MAEFSKLVITNNGQALLAKMIAGSGNIEFTKVSASSTSYTETQLEELTSLSEVKQTSLISKVTRTNEVAIKVEAAFTNTELMAGYYIRTLGLYAIDPDIGEILYAATREISGNCYMPAYNGITVSGAYVQLVTTVGNAENISLEVDPAAVATKWDLDTLCNTLEERITAINATLHEEVQEILRITAGVQREVDGVKSNMLQIGMVLSALTDAEAIGSDNIAIENFNTIADITLENGMYNSEKHYLYA